jgi:toxin-antitoxin system PIN domain toxin
VSAFLLDVNVLVALLWPSQQDHALVQQWFHRNAGGGWATCPITQAGFVRIVSNPSFSRDAIAPQDAVKLLAPNLDHPNHQFWTDDINFVQAAELFQKHLVGHKQVTDAYLLALAIHKKGRLATLDRKLTALLPEKTAARDLVTVI